jgi:hypothetical protein
MTSVRRTALVAGVLYLVTFISSIPSWFLLEPVLSNPNYIVSAGADFQVTWGALLDIVTAFAGIGTAVALFSVVKRQHEGLALGLVTTRLMEGAVILIGVVTEMAVVAMRQPAATGADAASLVALGRGLIAVHDLTFLFGPGLMPIFNAVLLGTLLYRSRLVPRLIPVMGLIGAPLLLSSTLGTMFGINEPQSAWTGIATIPIFFWELSVGLWMTFRGFNASAPILASPEVAVRARGSSSGGAHAAAEAGVA